MKMNHGDRGGRGPSTKFSMGNPVITFTPKFGRRHWEAFLPVSLQYGTYATVLGWKVILRKHNRGDFYSQFIMNFKWKQIFLTFLDFKCMCPGGQMFPGHMSPRTPVIPEHLSYPDTCLPGQKCPDMCYPDTFSPDKWGCTVWKKILEKNNYFLQRGGGVTPSRKFLENNPFHFLTLPSYFI